MSTENEIYHELWLKYYNIVVDITRAYNHIVKDKILTADMNFVEEVENILKENNLIE